MTNRYLVYLVCTAALACTSLNASAQEVSLRHKGQTLNANLELAAEKKMADGVILITHAGLAHGRTETVAYLQQLLKDKGYSSLALTLSLGVDNRQGMLDCKTTHRHHFADAAGEIGLWVDWLKGQGAKQLVLLGHSRGGSQTALYMTQQESAVVKAAVLLAPDTRATNDAAAYQQRHNKALAPLLQKAQALVQAGKGDTILPHTGILFCADTNVTAGTIVSYYGPDPRLDTPYLIAKIKKPTLIVIAGNDEVVIGFKDKFAPLVGGKHVQLKVVEGADHFFRDLYSDDAVDAIQVFLKGAGY